MRHTKVNKMAAAMEKFEMWCNYLRKSSKSDGEVLKRIYNKKTRIVLIYGDTDLPYKTPEELTRLVELEEQGRYKEWSDIVGLNYDEVPEV